MGYLDDMEEGLTGWMPEDDMSSLPAQGSQPMQPTQATYEQQQQYYGQPWQNPSVLSSLETALAQPEQPYQSQSGRNALPRLSDRSWDDFDQNVGSYFIAQPESLPQRRGTMINPIALSPRSRRTPSPPRRNAVSAPVDPLATATALEKQIFSNLIHRLEASGGSVKDVILDADTIRRLYATYATTSEIAAVNTEQVNLAAERAQAEKAEANVRAQEQASVVEVAEQAWADEYRAQLSPGRRADGTASGFDIVEIPFEDTIKYERTNRHKACVNCRREKRVCDRMKMSDGICTRCKDKQNLHTIHKFDASKMCFVNYQDTSDYEEFVNDRADKGGKAARMGKNWQTERYQKRKEREEAKKAEKEKQRRLDNDSDEE